MVYGKHIPIYIYIYIYLYICIYFISNIYINMKEQRVMCQDSIYIYIYIHIYRIPHLLVDKTFLSLSCFQLAKPLFLIDFQTKPNQ
jgi:hypothetical protein